MTLSLVTLSCHRGATLSVCAFGWDEKALPTERLACSWNADTRQKTGGWGGGVGSVSQCAMGCLKLLGFKGETLNALRKQTEPRLHIAH